MMQKLHSMIQWQDSKRLFLSVMQLHTSFCTGTRSAPHTVNQTHIVHLFPWIKLRSSPAIQVVHLLYTTYTCAIHLPLQAAHPPKLRKSFPCWLHRKNICTFFPYADCKSLQCKESFNVHLKLKLKVLVNLNTFSSVLLTLK